MPTPAFLATASRLASGPPALNTAFAAASTRSRLRTASARGLRTVSVACSAIPVILSRTVYVGPYLRLIPLFENDLFGKPRSPHRSFFLWPLENGGCLRIWRWIADLERAADRSAPIQV